MQETSNAAQQSDNTEPLPTLGANFQKLQLPLLQLTTKARVYGDTTPDAIEPTDSTYLNSTRPDAIKRAGHVCHFCRFRADAVSFLNDNHADQSEANMRAVDSVCNAWRHLGQIAVGKAYLAYVPGLSAQDVNHLQRTINIALHSEDLDLQADAKALINWLASHREYVKSAWGTYEPRVFADAIQLVDREQMLNAAPYVFEGLAVVLNPSYLAADVKRWRAEQYHGLPASSWRTVYQKYMNAAA